jgi:hypothetical protein
MFMLVKYKFTYNVKIVTNLFLLRIKGGELRCPMQ